MAKRVPIVAESMKLHHRDVQDIGHPVHFASHACHVNRNGKSKEQFSAQRTIHQRAGTAKHEFKVQSRSGNLLYLDRLIAKPGAIPPPPSDDGRYVDACKLHHQTASTPDPWASSDPWMGKSLPNAAKLRVKNSKSKCVWDAWVPTSASTSSFCELDESRAWNLEGNDITRSCVHAHDCRGRDVWQCLREEEECKVMDLHDVDTQNCGDNSSFALGGNSHMQEVGAKFDHDGASLLQSGINLFGPHGQSPVPGPELFSAHPSTIPFKFEPGTARAEPSSDDGDSEPEADEPPSTLTPLREKVRQMIAKALGNELAANIDNALQRDLDDKMYGYQSRAVIFNLNNETFRHKLLTGTIRPEQVPRLCAADMA